MSANTTVLITGGSRGLGKAFVELYIARPNQTVIAANRDPSHASSRALEDLPKGKNSSLIVLKLDATKQQDAGLAIKQLANKGIHKLDVVIANAGISQCWPTVAALDVKDMERHFIPNVYGVVWLYQAVLPLLNNANSPKFISIGSSAAFLTEMASRPIPNAAYAPSKVVLHWLTAKIHHEEPKLIALPLDPGWVQTDMGNHGAISLGYEQAETSTADSVNGMIKVIDAATKEEYSGKFWGWRGAQLAW